MAQKINNIKFQQLKDVKATNINSLWR